MKTMAEVLAEHYPLYKWHRDIAEDLWTCTSLDCQFVSQTFEGVITHQAEALTAAGFGPVKAAAAGALRDAAEHLSKLGWNNACISHLHSRVATIEAPDGP